MLNVFIGSDSRTNLDTSVCNHSIHATAAKPVTVTYLQKRHFPTLRTGLTDFTFSRFMCPSLCDYKGYSVFLDSDFVVLSDINELLSYIKPDQAVSIVDFRGELTFERTSLMVFNNELCTALTEDFINNNNPFDLITWTGSNVGSIPEEWNRLVFYSGTRTTPKAIHYTAGSPQFTEMRDLADAYCWLAAKEDMLNTCSWLELHGGSVHMPIVLDYLQTKEKNNKC